MRGSPVTVFDNRPDRVHIRALAARRGELPAATADCTPDCRDCYPWQETRRPQASPRRRTPLPERDESKPPKDPRYTWLPW